MTSNFVAGVIEPPDDNIRKKRVTVVNRGGHVFGDVPWMAELVALN